MRGAEVPAQEGPPGFLRPRQSVGGANFAVGNFGNEVSIYLSQGGRERPAVRWSPSAAPWDRPPALFGQC